LQQRRRWRKSIRCLGTNRISNTGTRVTISASAIRAFELQTVALGTYSVSATAAANASLGFNLYNALGSCGLVVTGVSPGGSTLFSLVGIAGTANLAAGGNVAGSVLFAATSAPGG